MSLFTISYDLKDSEEFKGSYREEIINFFLDNDVTEFGSPVASTVYYSSDKSHDFWVKKMEILRKDIWFVVSKVDESHSLASYYMWNSKGFKDEFRKEIESELKKRKLGVKK